MYPVDFPEANTVYAEHQPEYLNLPAYKTDGGMVTSCWRLSWRERLIVLLRGRVYSSVLTFNRPLQPQRLTIAPLLNEEPAEDEDENDGD